MIVLEQAANPIGVEWLLSALPSSELCKLAPASSYR